MPFFHLVWALVAIAIVAWLASSRSAVPGGMKAIAGIVLALLVVGIVLWLINTYVPMARSINAILNIVVVVATCVGVLRATGVWDELVRVWHDFRLRASH